VNFSLAPGSIPWLALALLLALALAVWAYRFALPPLAPGTRRLLSALRGLGLAVLLLLLARPLLSLVERPGRPEVLVLEDRSLSMNLPAGEGTGQGAPAAQTRAQVAERAAAELARRLGGRFHVRRWQFAARAFEAGSDSAGRLDRASTALGDAIAAAGDLPAVAAVVVVTDGVANRGRDPVQAARELGRPVSAVAVGETRGWDAGVEEVAVNPTARAGQPTPMEVRLRHTGPEPRRARLTVSDGDRVLAEKAVTLAAGGAETVEEVSFVPRRTGLAYYRVRLDAGPGEVTGVNNRRAAVQTVMPDRLRVLVLTAGLNWDWTWLKRTLDADSSWAAEYALVRDGQAAPVPGVRQAPDLAGGANLARYAVVVAQGLSGADARSPLGRRLAEYAQGGGGLALWSGEGAGGSSLAALRGTELGRAAAIDLAGGPPSQELTPELPPGEPHDIARIDDDPVTARRLFAGFAPLSGVAPLATRAGDQLVLEAAGSPTPLLLLRRTGRGRALLVNGSGLWRWGLSGAGAAGADRYARLWGAALRALAEPAQSEPLRVAAERPLFAEGEPVAVSASLLDAGFQPVDGAAVEVRLEAVGGLEGSPTPRAPGGALRLAAQGGGSYAGRWPPLAPGRYRVVAAARGRVSATATSEFVVDAWSPEYQSVEPDRRTLERAAGVSGGQVVAPARLGELARRVAARAATAGRVRERRLWEDPLAYAALVALLSGEWFLRRRRGLP
jgi:hypothetical protein